MKNSRIGRLAQQWAGTWDELELAKRRVSEARATLDRLTSALATDQVNLLAQCKEDKFTGVIVVPAWQNHAVVCDIEKGHVGVGIRVERD